MKPYIEKALNNLTTGWGAVVSLAGVLAFCVGAYSVGKSVVQLPAKSDSIQVQLQDHAATAKEQLRTDKLSLCIVIADHQHTDWTECLVKYGAN